MQNKKEKIMRQPSIMKYFPTHTEQCNETAPLISWNCYKQVLRKDQFVINIQLTSSVL